MLAIWHLSRPGILLTLANKTYSIQNSKRDYILGGPEFLSLDYWWGPIASGFLLKHLLRPWMLDL